MSCGKLLPRLLALAALLSAQSGCGSIRVNRTIESLVQESAWQPQPGTTPKQPLRYAIGQCFAEYVDGRVLSGFSSPLVFNAYEGCMMLNGYTLVQQPASK